MQLPACDAFAGTVLADEFLMTEPVQAAGGDHTIKITVAFLTERIAGGGLACLRPVPPVGFEPTLTAPEAVALSPELRGLRTPQGYQS